MRAIILAAGRSTRIRGLTREKPKCLIDLHDSNILGLQLDAISSCGVGQVSIVVGYMKQRIEEYLDGIEDLDLNIKTIYNEDFETTDNAYSLSLALNGSDDDPVIILDGDILFDPSLLMDLVTARSESSLLVDDSRKAGGEDCKVVVKEGYATAIGKRKNSDLIYTSMIKVGGELLEEFRSELNKNRERMEWYSEPLDRVLERNPRTMEVLFTNGRPRCEVDTEADLERALVMYHTIRGRER